MWRDVHNTASCIYTLGSCAPPSDQPEPNRAGPGALPGTQTNIRCGLQPAVHLPVRGGLLDISTYLFIYISTYLHIYISTHPGGRGGVLANAGDPARVRALLPQLHPVPVQDGGLPVGLQPEHPPHPRPGGTSIKFYQYIIKIWSSANK